MRILNSSSWSLVVVMAVMLAFIGLSLRLAYFASKLLPIVIGSIVFILAGIELGKEISTARRGATTARGDEKGAGEKSRDGVRIYLPIAAWVAGFALAIYLVGFILGSALFVMLYMKQHGSRWLMAVITAILFTAVIYSVFELALGVDLYRGLLPTWLGVLR